MKIGNASGPEVIFDRIINACLRRCLRNIDVQDHDTFDRYTRKIIKQYRENFINSNFDRTYLTKCRNKIYYVFYHHFYNEYANYA